MSLALPFFLRDERGKNHRLPSCAPQTLPHDPPSFLFLGTTSRLCLQLGFISLWASCLCEGPEIHPKPATASFQSIPVILKSLCPGVLPGWLVTPLASDSESHLYQAPAGILPPTLSPCCLETWHLLRPWAPIETIAMLPPRMPACLSTPAAQGLEPGPVGVGPSDLSYGPVFPEGTALP